MQTRRWPFLPIGPASPQAAYCRRTMFDRIAALILTPQAHANHLRERPCYLLHRSDNSGMPFNSK
jgi:hypothetical protein